MTTTMEIPANHFYMLKPGETRTFERQDIGHGIVVKLFEVGGGSFCRLDVRDGRGLLLVERSGTYQFQTHAINAYIAVLRWLVAQ